MTKPFGLSVLDDAVPVSPVAMRLVPVGVQALWKRIVEVHPQAESRPLLLSYDVHPSPEGPVLIEVNTNAGGARPGPAASIPTRRIRGFRSERCVLVPR